MPLATSLLASNFGSPNGVTANSQQVDKLWRITGYISIPIGVLVIGLILWCMVRYRHRAESDRQPAQFQYHIPLEATYTIIPLIIVAVLFVFLFEAQNKVDAVSKNPALKITVFGFQWGWKFQYPNGHQQVGTISNEQDINSNLNLPVLVMPTDETVQFDVVSLDVIHTFYVKEFLFQRDLIPGVHNVFDITVNTPGLYQAQCNTLCGEYHAYMRFLVQAMPPAEYQTWYSEQAPHSITVAGAPASGGNGGA
jgi:cytochrome c oxidase subunit 2